MQTFAVDAEDNADAGPSDDEDVRVDVGDAGDADMDGSVADDGVYWGALKNKIQEVTSKLLDD